MKKWYFSVSKFNKFEQKKIIFGYKRKKYLKYSNQSHNPCPFYHYILEKDAFSSKLTKNHYCT